MDFIDAFVTIGSGGLNQVNRITFGPDGHLYVCSRLTMSVLRFNGSTGAFIDEFVTSGAGGLDTPEAAIFGPDGHLYVTDSFILAVRRYNGTTGAFMGVFVSDENMFGPEGLVFGPDGHLYVAASNANQIRRYNGSTGTFLDIFADLGAVGSSSPEDLVFGSDGRLYVCSRFGDSVLRFDGSTGAFIDTFISSMSGGLDRPVALTFGPDGHLYVVSNATDSVLQYNGTTGMFLGIAVSSGLGGLLDPNDVVFGSDGKLYIASEDTNEVLRYSGAPTVVALARSALLPVDSLQAVTPFIFGNWLGGGGGAPVWWPTTLYSYYPQQPLFTPGDKPAKHLRTRNIHLLRRQKVSSSTESSTPAQVEIQENEFEEIGLWIQQLWPPVVPRALQSMARDVPAVEAVSKSAQELVKQANDRIHAWIMTRVDADATDIARLYVSSRERLMARLRALYDTYLAEEPSYVKARTSGAIHAINRLIAQDIQQLTDEVGQTAVSKMAGTLGKQYGVVEKALQRHLPGEFAALPVSTRGVLSELTTQLVGGSTFYDRLFNINDGLKRDLVNGVRQGLLNGEDFIRTRSRIMKAFGVDKLRKPTGPAYGSVKTYKNEARRQWNLLMRQQAESADGLEVWWAQLDSVTTPGCLARHGTRISRTGLPPRHINCRCEIAVFERGTNLEAYQQQALMMLEKQGYTKRSAMLEESMQPGYGWGRHILQPLVYTDLHADAECATVPWRHLPHVAATREVVWGRFDHVTAVDRADHVLLRRTGRAIEVRTWDGWMPVHPQACLIETGRGVADDSAVLQPPWDEHVQLLPHEIRERWPALAKVTIPIMPTYALALVTRQMAEQLTLGTIDPGEGVSYQVGEDFQALAMHVFWRQGHPPNPQLVVADATALQPMTILDITTGETLYATENFATPLLPPYLRVAAVIREDHGRIWAVLPRERAFWVLPGGHLEPGERPVDALVREIREETGLPIQPVRLLGRLYRPWSTTLVFLARRTGGQEEPSTPDEISGVHCIQFEDLAIDERLFLMRHGVTGRWQG